ncbi:hypothetical protein OSB04_007973 [Centaurea solstitialis]|uniref:Cation/H+ exchanger transmembrane domain-containing protein n=1 Tax=Centaurea solstitialis TaxID=347529 RepID=A0AA38TKW0_9ASTR|nr:hypothetical protein OSB04_007973 [Centaurea solstitialis]
MEAMNEYNHPPFNLATTNATHSQVVPITLFVAVLCLCLVIGHLLNENRWINESITAIIIGCIVGTIILCISKWRSFHLLRFNEELFFIYLLPPIIFNAGFQVKKKQFFQNFFPIMLFGVAGVFISTSIVAAGCWWLFPKFGLNGLTISEYLSMMVFQILRLFVLSNATKSVCLTSDINDHNLVGFDTNRRHRFMGLFIGIGTIFSSTDTVCTLQRSKLQVLHQDETPLLYSLVFGEGVVNDATSVVLFNAVRKINGDTFRGKAVLHILLDFLYLFSTSTLLGVTKPLSLLQKLLIPENELSRNLGFHSRSLYSLFLCVFDLSFIKVLESLNFDPISPFINSVSISNPFHCFLFLFPQAGLVTSYILRGLGFGRHSSVREISLMILIAYLSYTLAELFELSGILTVFFAGVLMSHYAWHNVTESSRITTRHTFAAMSFIAETFIFLYVGMDALDYEKWKLSLLSFWKSIGVYGTVMFLILLGRAAFVFPLSIMSNYMHKGGEGSSKITVNHQVVIWWAGLMRGAVSVALAFKQFTHSGVTLDPTNATMITTTIVIVLFSTIVFGFLTKPLISCLLPNHTTNNGITRRSTSPKEELTLPLLSFEESASENLSRAKENLSMLMEQPVYTIHSYWQRFDDSYMRPIFGGPRSNEISS